MPKDKGKDSGPKWGKDKVSKAMKDVYDKEKDKASKEADRQSKPHGKN